MRAYNSGIMTVGGCRGASTTNPKLTEWRPSGLPGLDYPFVFVKWPDETDDRQRASKSPDETDDRQRALNDFVNWLETHKDWLPEGDPSPTPPPPPQRAEELACAMKSIDERLRHLDLQFLLDVSGSMSPSLLPTSEAIPEIRQTLTADDSLSLSTFWQDKDGKLTVDQVEDQLEQSRLDKLVEGFRTTSRGWDAPLSKAIEELGEEFAPPARSVVVITDGGPFNDERDSRRAEQDIVRALRHRPTVENLYIIALGHGGCHGNFPQTEQVSGSQQRVVCTEIEGTQAMASALNKAIHDLRRWSR